MGHKVALLPVQENGNNYSEKTSTSHLLVEANNQNEFTVLRPVFFDEIAPTHHAIGPVNRLSKTIWEFFNVAPTMKYYPSINLSTEITRCADEFDADILLSFLSPLAAGAATNVTKYPKAIFQGNIDFITDKLRLEYNHLFQDSKIPKRPWAVRYIKRMIREKHINNFENSHKFVSLHSDIIFNTSAGNNQYYEDIGHPKVVYVGTIWSKLTDEIANRHTERAGDGSEERPFKIIGHAGYLGMTASTFGLEYLLKYVMPALRQEMSELAFEVHIIGGGEVTKALQGYLEQDNIIVRGYVKDLDSELLDSDVFLFLNNAGPLKSIFSRQIIAWALGLCSIVHEGSLETLPEIVHGENALVGASAPEIASLIKLACLEKDLNNRVRRGGLQTYEKFFTPTAVATKMLSVMEDFISPGGNNKNNHMRVDL